MLLQLLYQVHRVHLLLLGLGGGWLSWPLGLVNVAIAREGPVHLLRLDLLGEQLVEAVELAGV